MEVGRGITLCPRSSATPAAGLVSWTSRRPSKCVWGRWVSWGVASFAKPRTFHTTSMCAEGGRGEGKVANPQGNRVATSAFLPLARSSEQGIIKWNQRKADVDSY